MKIILILFLQLFYFSLYSQVEFNNSISFGSSDDLHACHIGNDGYIYSGLKFKDSIINVYTDTGKAVFNSHMNVSLGINKLDTNGNLLWLKFIQLHKYSTANSAYSEITGIVTDLDNNIYISGVFYGKVDFDPGLDTFYLTSKEMGIHANSSYFFLKLNSEGQFKWVKQIEAADAKGCNFFINGQQELTFIGTFGYGTSSDFDPDSTVYMSEIAFEMLFILRLDTGGHFISLKQIGNELRIGDVIQDYQDNIIIYGYFIFPQDFNPDTVDTLIQPTGYEDNFLAKYTPDGKLKWVNHFDVVYEGKLSVDTLNNIFFYGKGGPLNDTITFEIGNPAADHIFTIEENYFCKYSFDGNFQHVFQISGAESKYEPTASQGDSYGMHYISSSGLRGMVLSVYTSFRKIDEKGNVIWWRGFSSYNYNTEISFMKNISPNNFFIAGKTNENFIISQDHKVKAGIFYVFGKDLTSSINKTERIADNDNIIIYPNPVKDYLHIKYNGTIKNIQIFNINGQLLKTEFNNTIYVNDLKPGVYISIINFDPSQQIQFIKQ